MTLVLQVETTLQEVIKDLFLIQMTAVRDTNGEDDIGIAMQATTSSKDKRQKYWLTHGRNFDV